MRVGLYAEIERVNKEWLAARAADAGMPVWRAIDAILSEARARDWTLRDHPAQVVQP